jgi:hypothetical protein
MSQWVISSVRYGTRQCRQFPRVGLSVDSYISSGGAVRTQDFRRIMNNAERKTHEGLMNYAWRMETVAGASETVRWW